MPHRVAMDANLQAFRAHRASAESRGIAFRMTFAEWWSVWAPHWPRRHLDKLCMCRHGDLGDYAHSNVYIATARQNSIDFAANRRAAALRDSGYPAAVGVMALPTRLEQQQLRELLDALSAADDNLSEAARRLGITFRAARYILQKNGMNKAQAVRIARPQEK